MSKVNGTASKSNGYDLKHKISQDDHQTPAFKKKHVENYNIENKHQKENGIVKKMCIQETIGKRHTLIG